MSSQYDIGVLEVQVDRSEGYAVTACGALLVRDDLNDTLCDDADERPRSTTLYAQWIER